MSRPRPSRVGLCVIPFLGAALVTGVEPPRADAQRRSLGVERRSGRFFRDRGTVELIVAQGAWKAAFGVTRQAPGFDLLGASVELTLGLDVAAGLGIVANGRFFFNGVDAAAYLEGTGGVGLQVRLNRYAQIRLGADAGQVRRGDLAAPYVGGHLATSIGLFSLGPGRLMVAVHARLDAGALIGAPLELPEAHTGLSLGLGLRY